MPVEDVCKGGKIRVAWNEMPGWFDVDTKDNKMVQFDYPNSKPMHTSHLTYPHEILTSFMIEHQLSPIYFDNYWRWGEWGSGRWWGAVAMVRLRVLFKHQLVSAYLILPSLLTLPYKLTANKISADTKTNLSVCIVIQELARMTIWKY